MNEFAIPKMPVASDSLWSLLRTTPLRDALRGRLTGSLDVSRVIADANLPEALAKLIYTAVRRARLSRAKRLKAARELINMLRADIDAGHRPDELVMSFGDPAAAARLIRREKGLLPFAAVALPLPLAELVYRIARRTRLWRSERIDVARELAEHFRDGIAVGRTPEELVKSFGRPLQAARLIRRAKLRARPLAWRVLRRSTQIVGITIGLLVVTYAYLWLRYTTARPTLAHNFKLQMTAAARTVPEPDRAWPLYREAALHMTPEPQNENWSYSAAIERPGGKHWDLATAWVAENGAALKLIRQAVARPHLGFIYGDPGDRQWLEKVKIDPAKMDLSRNSELFILLPQIQELGNLFNLILADAHRAIAEGDAATLVRDIEVLVGLANQARDDNIPVLVSDAVSFHFLEGTLTAVDEVIADPKGLLSDDDLRRVAHCIAGYAGGGAIRCRLSGERLLFQDLYQRIYTDDGNGDGRLTAQGLQIFDRLKLLPKDGIAWSLTPVLCGVLSSRREMAQLTEEFFSRLEQEISQPLWESWNSTLRDDVEQCSRPPIDKIRHAPLVLFSTLVDSAFMGEGTTQKRDATLVALALELYRHRHGELPKTLNELVPDMLPAIPPDRFTGGPILYRVVDGRPILYSAGPDQRDDGGRSVNDRAAVHFFPLRSAKGTPNGTVPQGDLILWPPQPEKTSP